MAGRAWREAPAHSNKLFPTEIRPWGWMELSPASLGWSPACVDGAGGQRDAGKERREGNPCPTRAGSEKEHEGGEQEVPTRLMELCAMCPHQTYGAPFTESQCCTGTILNILQELTHFILKYACRMIFILVQIQSGGRRDWGLGDHCYSFLSSFCSTQGPSLPNHVSFLSQMPLNS